MEHKKKGLLGPPQPRMGEAIPFLFTFLFAVFSAWLLLGGCAAPGEPMERRPPVPQAITDLAAEQFGNDIILTFTLPKETVDHRNLKQAPAIEIYRDFKAAGANGAPAASPAPASLIVTIPSAITDRFVVRGRVRYADSLKVQDLVEHSGWIAQYTVRTRASLKKDSLDSNPATVRVYPAPHPIEEVKAEVTRPAIILTWTPSQETPAGPVPPIAAYHIYRAECETPATSPEPSPVKAAAESPQNPKRTSSFVKVGESQTATFQDAQFEFGKCYAYSVRSVAEYPGEALESADSKLALAMPRDVFPPSAPEGLLVVLIPAESGVPVHLELSWAINPETDVAGYNVYRSEELGVPGTRLDAEPLLTPAFRDMNVLSGHRYFYNVTAVDRAGNESPASAVAPGSVPAESQPTP
jgi:hypothetical protein